MKTFDIFIVDKGNKPKSPFLQNGLNFDGIYNTVEDISRQAENNKISCSIQKIELNDFPRNTEASAVIILEDRSYIPPDYLLRAIALKALHPNAAAFFGGRIARTNRGYDSPYFKLIDRTEKRFYLSYRINGLPKQYPSIYGMIINSSCYNTIAGYGPLDIQGNYAEYNHAFFAAIDYFGDFIYHKSIETICDISDASDEVIYNEFYQYGSECRFKDMNLTLESNRLGIKNNDDTLSWSLYQGWHQSGIYFKK